MDPKVDHDLGKDAAAAKLHGASTGPVPIGPRQISLYLVDGAEGEVCPFWVGLAAPGRQGAGQLLDRGSTIALLTSAAADGLSEQTPLMLADTTNTALRSVLLMPVPPAEPSQRSAWIDALTRALEPWHPRSLGVYLAPEALSKQDSLELLTKVLQEVVQTQDADTIYLMTGAHGTGPILNTALRLKAALHSDRLNLYVFH